MKELMKSATTWMDLEIIILSKVRKRKIPYAINYTWNQKKKLHKLTTYKTEIYSLT